MKRESEHKKKKRIARDHKHGRKLVVVHRGLARSNLRQSDFKVVARGVRREEPDIERVAAALFKAYVDGDLDELFGSTNDEV